MYHQKKIDGFLDSLKIRDIPGIGKKTEQRFTEMNLETIGDVKRLDVFTLNKEFGRKKWNIHLQCSKRN